MKNQPQANKQQFLRLATSKESLVEDLTEQEMSVLAAGLGLANLSIQSGRVSASLRSGGTIKICHPDGTCDLL